MSAPRRRRALTGAWIETVDSAHAGLRVNVAPSRARGLKLCFWHDEAGKAEVAPSRARGLKRWQSKRRRRSLDPGRALTGAWIETGESVWTQADGVVAPSRARGLKLAEAKPVSRADEVAPSRARGLKRSATARARAARRVAPSRARGLKRSTQMR